jgi:iron only hydrogenase large subunit-like protein
MKLLPIYTQTKDCRDCYKCIRECPVKAIKVTDHKASLTEERCIFCGHCVTICPAQAKKVRNDTAIAKQLIKSGRKTIASLAPSFINEFTPALPQQIVAALKKLGFNSVSETALGAQGVSAQTAQFLTGRSQGAYISSACPSVVEYIRKYHPQHSLAITPFMSPLLTHAQMIKQWAGNDVAVVFIGPCIAKKTEADQYPGLLDAAITFNDLANWFKEESIDPSQLEGDGEHFFPMPASDGVLYPIDGGMLSSIKQKGHVKEVTFMSFSGQRQVADTLEHLSEIGKDRAVFLELLTCEGGCVNGPGTCSKGNLAMKRLNTINTFNKSASTPKPLPQVKNERDFFDISPMVEKHYDSVQLSEALNNIGKQTPQDELNCSGCGYDTCRDFARALLNGMAEPAMCVSFMRKVAHNQATILLQKIPSGVIVVDENLKVVEMNQSCAKMLGPDIELIYEAMPGLAGASIAKLGKLSEHFMTAMHTGKEFKEIPITENNRNYQLSIFNIQKHKLITGIIQNMGQPQFNMDIIEKRTREVIQKNMETVQRIAVLLGENAAVTDSLLNSIMNDGKGPVNKKEIAH